MFYTLANSSVHLLSTSFLCFSIIYFAVSILYVYIREVTAREDFLSRRLLIAERQKTEELLLNMLPPDIAFQMLTGSSNWDEQFDCYDLEFLENPRIRRGSIYVDICRGVSGW